MAYMIKLTDILSEVIDYEFYDYINSKNSLFEVCNLLEFPVRVDTINMSIFDDIKSNHDYVLRVKKFGKLVGHYEKYDIYQFTPINDSSALNDVFVYKDMVIYFSIMNWLMDLCKKKRYGKIDLVWDFSEK